MRFMVIKKGPLPRARLVEGDRRSPRVQYIRYNTVVATNCRFRVIHSDGSEETSEDTLGFASPIPNTTRVVHAVEDGVQKGTNECLPPLDAAPEATFRPRTPPGRPPRYQPKTEEYRPHTPPRPKTDTGYPVPTCPLPPALCLPPPPYPQRLPLPPRLPRFTLIRRKQ